MKSRGHDEVTKTDEDSGDTTDAFINTRINLATNRKILSLEQHIRAAVLASN